MEGAKAVRKLLQKCSQKIVRVLTRLVKMVMEKGQTGGRYRFETPVVVKLIELAHLLSRWRQNE